MLNSLTPIPQDKIAECSNWRNWFNTIQQIVNPIVNGLTAVQTTLATGVSGTFKSSDTPAKTITVTNGIITSIK